MELLVVYRRMTITAGVCTFKFWDWQGAYVAVFPFTVMSQLKPGLTGMVMLSSNGLLVAFTTYVVTLGLKPGMFTDGITTTHRQKRTVA